MTQPLIDTVDLFAGPGGLDLAARALGLHPVGIEFDPAACATRRAAGLETIEGDVRGYGPDRFPDARTLIGGPPCQTFSAAGAGGGRRELDQVLDLAARLADGENLYVAQCAGLIRVTDPRTLLVLEPLHWALRAIDAGRPYRTIVLEQVPAVLAVWEAYAEHLRARGYHVATGVLRAEQYGVPQTRRRAFLAASLDGPVALPSPTHRAYRKGVDRVYGPIGELPWVSMGQVLPHLGPFTMISNYGTGGDPARRGIRSSAEPAPTVTGRINRNRLIRSDDCSEFRLSPADAGRLQGFPSDYPWHPADVWQQIGNACPPMLARAVLAAALAASRAALSTT